MDTSGLLQGFGLFICIGAILLVALIAFAARALTRGRNTPQQPTVWNTPGDERPRYDQPDIKTQGGFGGAPSTVDRDPVVDRDFDRTPLVDRDSQIDRDRDDQPSSGDRLVDYNRDRNREDSDTPPRGAGGFGGQQNDPPSRSDAPRRDPPRRDMPRRDRVDDDDVSSSGGFGGG